ncbi:MAG TPA: helix-turn-helix transcriptional regulator [Streptosporangiaceae bacterium]
MGSSTAYTRARETIGRLCASGAGPRALRLEALAVIRPVVGFDAYAWLVTDPETAVGSSPLADVPCLPRLPELIRLKYLTAVNRWTALPGAVASLAQATGGELSRSLLWRELLREYQVTDIASSVYRDRFGCWGFLDLWRAGAPPFTPEELGFLAGVAGPLTAALRQGVAASFTPGAAGDQLPEGPVVLLLSPDLVVRAQTPQTQRYLTVLVPPEEGHAPVPAGAYNVAAQLLAAEAGTDAHPPAARVHLAAGRWLTLRAARIGAGDTGPGDTGQEGTGQEGTGHGDTGHGDTGHGDNGHGDNGHGDIAVSIEPAAPGDRVSVFARACGLSRRETELLDHLVPGAGTRDIAGLMFVSENTVQDHLKSIFAKTATRSRRSLLARALGV